MLSNIERISVMCIIVLVNKRIRIRYTVESSKAAAAMSNRRYTVLL